METLTAVQTVAGSDTTALTLRAIFYYALKNPRVRRKLYGELAAARPTLPISYDFAQKLPYLDAVIRESMRMHPGVGLPLERVVPSEGLKLPDGRFIAGGTAVGMNAWVVHQNKEIFGQDAESFVPERWLQYEHETETSFQARRSRMREADLTFGAGNRVCTGKNIALLQLYKVVATLFILYDVSPDQTSFFGIPILSAFFRSDGARGPSEGMACAEFLVRKADGCGYYNKTQRLLKCPAVR